VLVAGTGRVETFLWKLYSDLFLYSAERVPEIADEIYQIDRAMRWGYANKLGPFETWDALGFKDVCKRLEKDHRALPENVQTMLKQGAESLYLWSIKGKQYFDFTSAGYKPFRTPLLPNQISGRQRSKVNAANLNRSPMTARPSFCESTAK
jgi:3-hydroxyacyl-CoA dehydrogenase